MMNTAYTREHSGRFAAIPRGFRSDSGKGLLDGQAKTHDEPKWKSSPEKRLLCATCGHYITSRDRSREMSGNHVHVFTNPAGFTFRIGCFSSAPGCITAGEPTGDYTWFPGYDWSFALCGGCMAHLGWLYESGSDSFYGLILAELAEEYLQ